MCFSETHLTNEIGNDFIKLDGSCDPFRKDSMAHSGGPPIYVSDKLVAVRKPDLESQSVSSIWVEIKYKDKSFLLSNVYRSPNMPVSFWQDFKRSIENASDLVKRVIIVGDINGDQLNINSRYIKIFS